ncbi:DUF5134 domain-containing protein [Mycobacterium uberis]|uniref:DUF5134 domain-containing protein n=1 Tax=Mycobacterium uberis TaxID=2162698 RepID=UPI001FB41D71|nr:DUF5134 domain-containing protein [Mycobacterium uberis]
MRRWLGRWVPALPTTRSAVLFVLTGVWFVTLATVSARRMTERAVCVCPAPMMVARGVWMYVVMDSHLRGRWGTGHHASPYTPMPGMDMTTAVALASDASG